MQLLIYGGYELICLPVLVFQAMLKKRLFLADIITLYVFFLRQFQFACLSVCFIIFNVVFPALQIKNDDGCKF